VTVFKKSLLILSTATIGLITALAVSVLAFMNSLYYETNASLLRDAAVTLFSITEEEVLSEFFAPNSPGDAPAESAGRPQPGLFSLKSGDLFRLTLIDSVGTVLWDSQVEQHMVNHIDREEVRAALEGREGKARRKSLSTGLHQLYSALPVYQTDGGIAGVFRLSLAIPGFWQRIRAAALPFLMITALLILAAFAAVFFISNSLSKSISRLVGFAQTTAGKPWFTGDLPAVPCTGIGESEAEEFLTLEKALRGMAAELNFRYETARTEGRRLEAILAF